jgi:hypothetical protein
MIEGHYIHLVIKLRIITGNPCFEGGCIQYITAFYGFDLFTGSIVLNGIPCSWGDVHVVEIRSPCLVGAVYIQIITSVYFISNSLPLLHS